MYQPVLDVLDLEKTYSGRHGSKANDGISIRVGSGEVVGLLGHNGAGKTTLVNQIVGILKPDGGVIEVSGHDVISKPQIARRLVSVQAQANVPITGLSPRKAIELVGRIRGLSKQEASTRAVELLTALEMEQWADKPAQAISGGVARLTAFGMATAAPGELVILDEPTNDVDPVRRKLLWAEIRRLADSGVGVLLVTHNVAEAEHVVDSLVILDHGKVIAQGTPAELSASTRGELSLTISGLRTEPDEQMNIVSRNESGIVVRVRDCDAPAAIAWASDHAERFSLAPTTLEDIYISLVKEAA